MEEPSYNESPPSWINYKLWAAPLRQTTAETKDDYNAHVSTYVFDPTNRKAVLGFMKHSKNLSVSHICRSDVLTSAEAKTKTER